jgi:aryl-alcohol dehydrogenase-like predicted oxidoreductase
MKEITLGGTGLRVKTMGFGGIPIQRVTEEEAVAVVRRCYELGVNYFDTARGYTVSEERIGKALEDVRDEVVLATKSGKRTARELEVELETSLGNLRTDRIDLYQLHNVSSHEAWEKIKSPGGATPGSAPTSSRRVSSRP